MTIQTPPLEEIITQWERDSVIDQTEPGKEIIEIPKLHNKYNKYLSLHNLAAIKAGIEFDRVKRIKWEYYTGKLDQEELVKYGWEPFRFVLKSDISVYMEGDEDLNKIKRKKSYHEEAAKFCQNIMKELQSRTYQLRAFMDWEKFIQGAR
jgi:hypothetical protein